MTVLLSRCFARCSFSLFTCAFNMLYSYEFVCLFVCLFVVYSPPLKLWRTLFAQEKKFVRGKEKERACRKIPCIVPSHTSHDYTTPNFFASIRSLSSRRALTQNQKYKSRRDAVRAEKYLNHRRRWLYCLPRGHSLREEVPAVQGSLSEFIVVHR